MHTCIPYSSNAETNVYKCVKHGIALAVLVFFFYLYSVLNCFYKYIPVSVYRISRCVFHLKGVKVALFSCNTLCSDQIVLFVLEVVIVGVMIPTLTEGRLYELLFMLIAIST